MSIDNSALIATLVPPRGKTGTFSRNVVGEHVHCLTVPRGRRVAVVETVPGGAKYRAGRTLAGFLTR
jgi:hypothetical protein